MDETAPLTTIGSEQLRASIHPLGAQLYSLQDSSHRDLQWNGDPAIWKGRAPILFPIIGELVGGQYTLDGTIYRLPRHGFARDRLFQLVSSTTATALFRLRSDAETLQVYPFHFELDVAFSVTRAALTITASIKNSGASDMPASFGFHPALRWPLPYGESRSDHAIWFEHDEPAPIRRLDGHGLLRPESFATPVEGRMLRLRDELFVDDAVIFDRLQSQRLWYGADRGPRVQIDFVDTPYLAMWSKQAANFVCIEPWHGHADPEGFNGDFRNKPGVFAVPPAGQKSCAMTLTLQADRS
jgi:galactose mutarotase-like enzyme